MKKFKIALTTMLVVLMTLSSAVFGLTGVSAATTKSVANVPTLEVEKPAVKVPEKFVNPEDPSKTVRVIVELEKAPTIETATQKGVLYKDLPKAQRASLEAAVESDQVTVQSAVKKTAPSVTYLENFTTVFNGFSAEVFAGQVEKIANVSGVKNVYEATEYTRPSVQPEMKYSKALVQAQKAWKDYGFKGEGMVVGVIDTGIDPSHKDMVLTDDASGEITKSEVQALLNNDSIENGEYFTAKVPFGWNYMDDNNQILDLGPDASMHGMHVAGTVGANGDEDAETPGIKGVAPEAQLLALKVFGNDPDFASTYGDIYVKAIDDSIKLGADVINMSLGSVAGFVDSSHPEQMAVERSTENGILVSISAGNSDMFGSGYFYPYAENQDYGLTGSPSVSEDSLGVASFENDVVTGLSFNYHANGAEAGQAMYLLANDADPRDLPNASYEVVHAGFGMPADYEGKDLKGKFALVSRGSIPFVEKGLNAQAAGAAGVIVYNNTTGTISMASDAAIKIPYMSTLQKDGLAMKALIDAGSKVTVSFEGDYLEMQNPNAGKMSDFTSWGPTPNLDFKPEITAPGGNIFSTLNDNQYGLMSGTSMAAPHVAGGTALVFERVDKEFGLTGAERVQFAKNLMMNTANPVEMVADEYVSPRRQGAGLMQLHDALSTDVMVTNVETGEAKVALKEISNDQFTFTLEAENFSNEAVTYNVDVNVQTDYPVTASGYNVTAPNLVGSYVVSDMVDIAAPATVTVPANGTETIKVTVDVSALKDEPEYKMFTNGFFVDGFVTLTDANEEVTGNTALVVPYFGFNGGWDDANIFDYFAWDAKAYYGESYLRDGKGRLLNGGTHLKGYDPAKFAFSPNGDGSSDSVIPVFTLLRNAKQFEVNILNEAGTKIRTIRTAEDLTKHFSLTAPSTTSQNYAWDGKANGKTVADGNYKIQLRAVIDFPNAEWQAIEFPVKVDTVKPAAKATYNVATKTVEVAEFADNTGTDRWEVYLNGAELTENTTTPADESLAPATTKFAVTANLKITDKLVAKFYDTAGNFTEVELPRAAAEEKKAPVIFIKTPEVTQFFDTKEVKVAGTVEDDSHIVSLTVNGKKADLFDGVNFEHTLTFEDGVHDVKVKAVDEFGNEMEIRRQIFVDTTAASVELLDAPKVVDINTNKAQVTVNVQDNFDQIAVYVNDSEVYRNTLTEPYAMYGFDEDITFNVPVLEKGQNNYTIKVIDLVGNETELKFSIIKEKLVTFSDIQKHWAKEEIETLATLGIIQGISDDLFAPEKDLTRAQYATLLVRTLDLELKPYEGKFKDVSAKHWAAKHIEAAARAGIVLGNSDKTFRPDTDISRQDTAVMVVRAIKYHDASLLKGLDLSHKYADQNKIQDYAVEAVSQAYALGLMTGRDKNVFAPRADIKRGETAVVVYRAYNLIHGE